jgi:hypothetical protein
MRPAVLLAGALALLASCATAPRGAARADDFAWSEEMGAGALLRIHNYQGPVEVRGTDGPRVEVRARGDHGKKIEFRYEVVRSGADVTLCSVPTDGGTCAATGLRTPSPARVWDEGVVGFTVLLPRGVRLHARSDNGAVEVRGAGADVVASSGNGLVRVEASAAAVRAFTGNGSVSVSTAAGPVNVETGNGSIDVRMLRLPASGDMHFRTGNGSVDLHLPGDASGEVDARTGHGFLTSDFPLTTRGGHARGTLGAGGPRLQLSTARGPITLRRLK